MKKNKYFIVLAIYFITFLWSFIYMRSNDLAYQLLEYHFILIQDILGVIFLIFIVYCIISLTHIEKENLLPEFIIIDIPALVFISLNVLFFLGIDFFPECQKTFRLFTIVGSALIAGEIKRFVLYFKKIKQP